MSEENIKFSPWWWEAAPRLEAEQTPLPCKADVVIVGSGFTGLSAALTLSRAGREVTVLDAECAGYGASTRNGGQVGSGNQKFSVGELEQRYGKTNARALILEGTAALEYIEQLIQQENIECHFNKVGRFRGAVLPKHYDSMARKLEELKKVSGAKFFMVPKGKQHEEIGSDFYHGGSVLPNDFGLHPGLYHRGLSDRARASGAVIFPYTTVKHIEQKTSGIAIHTSRGSVLANECIVATNGYSELVPDVFKKSIVAVGSAIVSTEEIPNELMQTLLPKRRMMGESRRVFHYFRSAPDSNRVLFGGRTSHAAPADSMLAYRHLHHAMLEIFPQLKGTALSHCWSGKLGFTRDDMPHLGSLSGIHYALGYCGTGISRSTWLGHKIALQLLGDANGKSAFGDLPFRSFPFHSLSKKMVPVVSAWLGMKDKLRL